MLRGLVADAEHIYIACGYTDFRKQAEGLVALVSMKFGLDPFETTNVFLFCNRKRNTLKVLRFDENGFILASKKLLQEMRFQWPKKPEEVKDITARQVKWLLEGLEIEQKKALREIKPPTGNMCY